MNNSCIYKAIFLLLVTFIPLKAQTFGFGCLGLSGFYGGYGVHTYNLDGLNESIALKYNFIPNISNDIKFEQSTGFRFGANILRADFDVVFLTAKAFYQFSKENKSAEYTLTNNSSQLDFELTSNHWGVAIDFGVPLFSFVDLKIVEGGITFYQIELKEKIISDEGETSEETFQKDGTNIGYYIGAGLILNIVKGYISLEGTAMYHFLTIDKIENSNGSVYPLSAINKSFLDEGGFAAAVQLNIGFPL